ncbi:MAG: hypothetical protein JXB38_19455 [Anaerolineales bacterium]|nr:hypothetical protein [Anaerolineales bacterium]
MAEIGEVRSAKSANKKELLNKPNVVGVATGYKITDGERTDQLSVVVMVREKKDVLAPEDLVPRQVNGVVTDVLQVGELRAFQNPTDKFRPAPGGVSIGHVRVTAGTLGAVVRDRTTGERLILSNNHVLANSNDAEIGDVILQPGTADGGSNPRDQIGTLARFVPIDFGESPGVCGLAGAYAAIGNILAILVGSKHRVQTIRINQAATNYVDCALARPLNDADVLDEILNIGEVNGIAEAYLGMPVRKSGRTTGFTTGEIQLMDATVSVSYGVGQTAQFEDQLIAGPMSQGGDSGSLVVAGDSQQAVGLLFAGSNQTTILNPIQHVLDALNIEI